jgi:hypothetical protein
MYHAISSFAVYVAPKYRYLGQSYMCANAIVFLRSFPVLQIWMSLGDIAIECFYGEYSSHYFDSGHRLVRSQDSFIQSSIWVRRGCKTSPVAGANNHGQ